MKYGRETEIKREDLLEALHSLKAHLTITLDSAVSHGHYMSESEFLHTYYAHLKDLEEELEAILGQSSLNPVLILGRAGTGKTTFLAHILEMLWQRDKLHPVVRVPFILPEAFKRRERGISMGEILEQEILTECRRILVVSGRGDARKAWLRFLSNAIVNVKGSKRFGPEVLSARDLVQACFPLDFEPTSVDEVQRKLLATGGAKEIRDALKTLSERASIQTHLQAIALNATGSDANYCHLLIDNIENAEVLEAVKEMRTAIKELPDRLLAAGRLICAMRFTSVNGFVDSRTEWEQIVQKVVDEEEVEAQRPATSIEPPSTLKINVGSRMYEAVLVPGGRRVAYSRFSKLAKAILEKRIEYSESQVTGAAAKQLLGHCKEFLDDQYVMRTLCQSCNYHLRDMFVMLSNLAEELISEDRIVTGKGPATGRPGGERLDSLASIFYHCLGFKGVEGLIGRNHPSKERAKRVSQLGDPIFWAEHARSTNSLRALRDRLVLGAVYRNSRVNDITLEAHNSVLFDKIVDELLPLGYQPAEVGESITALCGDEMFTGYIEAASERFGLFATPASGVRYCILPRGIGFVEQLGQRYGYWVGLAEKAKLPLWEVVPQSSTKGKRLALEQLLVLQSVLNLGRTEVSMFIGNPELEPAKMAKQYLALTASRSTEQFLSLRTLETMKKFWLDWDRATPRDRGSSGSPATGEEPQRWSDLVRSVEDALQADFDDVRANKDPVVENRMRRDVSPEEKIERALARLGGQAAAVASVTDCRGTAPSTRRL